MTIKQAIPNQFFGTYYGLIRNDEDAARVIEGCIQSKLPLIKTRLKEWERSEISGGYVFVFKASDSNSDNSNHDKIQRWTDGRLWSPSKIYDSFLIYCELIANFKPISLDGTYHPEDKKEMEYLDKLSQDKKNELGVISRKFWIDNQKGVFIPKIDGLVKKTVTVKVAQGEYHLISYDFAQLPKNHPYPMLSPDNYSELKNLKVDHLVENLKIRFKKCE